jgi:hypothetical protein
MTTGEFITIIATMIGVLIACLSLKTLAVTLQATVEINLAQTKLIERQLHLAELEDKRDRRSIMPFLQFELLKVEKIAKTNKDRYSLYVKCSNAPARNIRLNLVYNNCISLDKDQVEILNAAVDNIYLFRFEPEKNNTLIKCNSTFEDQDGVMYSQEFAFSTTTYIKVDLSLTS